MSEVEANWVYGFFQCQCLKCCFGCVCPVCAFAHARTQYDGSNMCFNCCCVTPCAARSIVREGYHIKGSCIGDIFSTCCPGCAYSQMAREIAEPNRTKTSVDPSQLNNNFTKGLCQCKCGAPCLYAFCCPACASASVRTSYDNSNCCFNCLCLTVPLSRNIIREGYKISGTCVQDILMGCLCSCCTIHQLQQEVQARKTIAQKIADGASAAKEMV